MIIYSLLYLVVLVFLLPFEYRKRPKEDRDRWLSEKLGGVRLSPEEEGVSRYAEEKGGPRPLIWIHAVSVGEAIAAASFLNAFRERHPGYRVVVSTITDTGQQVARERCGENARIIYMPFDLGFALRRAISRLRPALFIIMETEIWPNTFKTFREAGVPVVLLNGRISEKSYRGYRKIKPFMGRVLKSVSLFCMQDETYARRIVEMGAERNKVIITGSFKFDIKVKDEEIGWVAALTKPLIVAGSTHRGEDELVVEAFRRLEGEFPGLSLVIAPRHPERAGEVEEILRGADVPYELRSRAADRAKAPVVVLDTVGELSAVYKSADVAVIGGSFVEHGGHNFLEPAYWGKPVVCGPHMENFPFIAEFYEQGAALEADGSRLYTILKDLLSSPEAMGRVGSRAKELLERNSGAVATSLEAIGKLIQTRD